MSKIRIFGRVESNKHTFLNDKHFVDYYYDDNSGMMPIGSILQVENADIFYQLEYVTNEFFDGIPECYKTICKFKPLSQSDPLSQMTKYGNWQSNNSAITLVECTKEHLQQLIILQSLPIS